MSFVEYVARRAGYPHALRNYTITDFKGLKGCIEQMHKKEGYKTNYYIHVVKTRRDTKRVEGKKKRGT